MAPSLKEKQFAAYIVDLMQSLGSVNAKAMFGGFGIFLNGTMFGLVFDNVLYLKADKETKKEFKELGLEPFTYIKKGKELKMSYFQAPEDAVEDHEIMKIWGLKAYNSALRAVKKTKK